LNERYDVAIIGAGPAGILCAIELARRSPSLRAAIFEKGLTLDRRRCPLHSRGTDCARCNPCHNVAGWGGAGAFSDGKLTLTTEFGGNLAQHLGKEHLQGLIDYCDEIFLEFGAPDEVFGGRGSDIQHLLREAASVDLTLIPARIRHLGTERCTEILRSMHSWLVQRVDIRTSSPVARILTDAEGRAAGVELESGEAVESSCVVAAPGRSGAAWMRDEAIRLGIPTAHNPVDIGIRVEVPAVVLEHITEAVYESKLVYYSKSFDDKVRSFCMCPYGEVTLENNEGVVTVNGHSYREKRTDNTNFALLVSKSFTEPFKEPIRYGRNIASLANMLGGGALVQRLGDLMAGRRSTQRRLRRGMVEPTLEGATPGDLSLVLPYRHLLSILEMLEAMDHIAPGVNSRHTLLYGVEVKFYSSRLELDHLLETTMPNLFAVGDGAGITRGLSQASASGVHVARAIADRLGVGISDEN